jgi:uncharacterized membrane protein YgdD (TMEM256/DUF423 family)
MNWTGIGAVFLTLAVGLGAFGAHGLRDRLSEYSLSVYEKAVFYHFVHALGIVITALLAKAALLSEAGANRVCWLLSLGIVLFSGSLYALAVSGVRVLGAVTPFGGIAFIGAWLLLAFEAFRFQR